MPTNGQLLPPELLAQLERLELVTRKVFRGRMKGERRSRRKGQSVEFADFRNYVQGDDLRFIDWNLYARLDKLFLKLFLEEEDLHFYTLIDASTSMDFGEPSKLFYARQLAAALGFVGLCRSDRVKIETLGTTHRRPGPVLRGRHSVWRMLEFLNSIEPGENVSLAEGVKNFCVRNSGKGILVLVTDLMDKTGYETALRMLVAREMDVYVIHLLSQEELDPDVKGDLRLVDCEDADMAEITVSRPLLDRYKRTLAGFINGAGILHAAGHELLSGEQPGSGGTAGHQLPSSAGVGAMSGVGNLFINMLAPWQWAILLTVPPIIIALYFLKLKRQPLEVPSTYLWHRAIEDLHVNSLWQRLRRSILLLLQLLLVALLMFAVLRPGWRGATLQGDRFIFLIDNSASMTATDIKPTRLDEAKRRVTQMINQMKSGDVAMVVSFSDRARIDQPFTDNRRVLRNAVAGIGPTSRTSDLSEALRVAASLANPGRISEAGSGDVPWAEARKADLYIFTDGGFGRVPNFSMGNLAPTYVPIGLETARNVGITAFSTQRNAEKPEQLQAFARLENFGDETATVTATLTLNGQWPDTQQVNIPAGEAGGIEFELKDLESGTLQLTLDDPDDLAADNVAYAAINTPRRARVLLITPQNEALALALSTDRALKLAETSTATPKILESKVHQKQAEAGAFDLIIYDQCAPQKLPPCSTLFIGSLPLGDTWSAEEPVGVPQIIDTQRTHPIMRYIDLGNVTIAEAQPLNPPPGSTHLIEASAGPICAIAPRLGFEDCVLGFEIVGQDKDGNRYANTDWVRRYSFPLFVQNVLEYLGGAYSETATGTVQPGKPMAIRSATPAERVIVVDPQGNKREVVRQGQSGFVYGHTDRPGTYEVVEGKTTTQRFTVNLFEPSESNIRPKEVIRPGYEEIKGQAGWLPMRRELWRWIVAAALVLLGLEWYIYNRRVYL